MSIWTYQDKPFLKAPEEDLGFIYEITHIETNRTYIGKKQFWTTRKLKPLKGKKNKRHKTVETDWKIYTSSSDRVNNDITKYGVKAFTYKIIRFCKSKWELAYYEAKEQFDKGVLLSEDYYNGIINLRIGDQPNSLKTD